MWRRQRVGLHHLPDTWQTSREGEVRERELKTRQGKTDRKQLLGRAELGLSSLAKGLGSSRSFFKGQLLYPLSVTVKCSLGAGRPHKALSDSCCSSTNSRPSSGVASTTHHAIHYSTCAWAQSGSPRQLPAASELGFSSTLLPLFPCEPPSDRNYNVVRAQCPRKRVLCGLGLWPRE